MRYDYFDKDVLSKLDRKFWIQLIDSAAMGGFKYENIEPLRQNLIKHKLITRSTKILRIYSDSKYIYYVGSNKCFAYSFQIRNGNGNNILSLKVDYDIVSDLMEVLLDENCTDFPQFPLLKTNRF